MIQSILDRWIVLCVIRGVSGRENGSHSEIYTGSPIQKIYRGLDYVQYDQIVFCFARLCFVCRVLC